MKKELNIISMEGEVLLKDNLVRSSILPHTASELDRNVTILADAVVEGAVYANKLEIESGDAEICGAVYTKLELHVNTKAKGKVILRKSVRFPGNSLRTTKRLQRSPGILFSIRGTRSPSTMTKTPGNSPGLGESVE